MSTSKKHIGFYCSSRSWGGLEMNIGRFATWLRTRNYPITVFCIEDSELSKYCKKQEIPSVFIKKQGKHYDFGAVFAISKLLRKHKIEIFAVTDNRDLSLLAGIKWRLGNTVTTLFFQGMQFGMEKKDFLHTFRYKKIDGWLAPLNWLKEQVIANTNIRPQNVFLLPLGIELESFISDVKPKEELRKEFEIPKQAFVLGLVGRIDAQKGQQIILDALVSLPEDTHVLFVGDKTEGEAAEYEKNLLAFVEQNKLTSRVHFRPFTNNVGAYFKAMDVFIMASKKETFGLVTVEAMAAGLAVVGTNAGGTKEILGEGAYGVLFEPGNSKQLSERLQELIKDAKLTKSLGDKAKERAVAEYSHELMCDRLEEIMEKLA